MADDTPEISGSSSATDPMDAARKPRVPPTIDVEASRVHRAEAEADEVSSEFAGDDGLGAQAPSGSSRRAHRSPFGVVFVASIGLAAALLIGSAAWFAGLFDGTPAAPDPTTAAVEALDARLSRLESAPKPAIDEPNAQLVERLDALEKSVSASLSVSHDEIASVRTKTDRTASSLDEIKASLSNTTPSLQSASQPGSSQSASAAPDLSNVENRLAELDAKIQALSAENAQLKASQSEATGAAVSHDDSRLKRAIAANALDVAVRQSEPFSHLLTAAKQLSDNSAELQPLERFAANGVPSAAVLSRDLLAVLPQLGTKSDHVLQSDGWLDWLRINAARLVKIRRMDTAETGTSGVIERIPAAIRRQDIMEAKRELNTLPPLERAKAQPWIDQVDAREAALAASRAFSSQAIMILAKPVP